MSKLVSGHMLALSWEHFYIESRSDEAAAEASLSKRSQAVSVADLFRGGEPRTPCPAPRGRALTFSELSERCAAPDVAEPRSLADSIAVVCLTQPRCEIKNA